MIPSTKASLIFYVNFIIYVFFLPHCRQDCDSCPGALITHLNWSMLYSLRHLKITTWKQPSPNSYQIYSDPPPCQLWKPPGHLVKNLLLSYGEEKTSRSKLFGGATSLLKEKHYIFQISMLSEEIFLHPPAVWVVLRQMCSLPDFPTCIAHQPGWWGRIWPLGMFLGASDTLLAPRDGWSAVNLFWSLQQLLCFISLWLCLFWLLAVPIPTFW